MWRDSLWMDLIGNLTLISLIVDLRINNHNEVLFCDMSGLEIMSSV